MLAERVYFCPFLQQFPEAAESIKQDQPPEVFYKKICVGVSFLIKFQAFRPAALLKRDSNTSVFL